MKKKRKPIKAKWEWVNTTDAEERLQAAFDIIFSRVEELRIGGLPSPSESNLESQEARG